MLQLRVPVQQLKNLHAAMKVIATKTQHSQISKYIFKKQTLLRRLSHIILWSDLP